MKYAALALEIGKLGSNIPFFILDEESELKLFTSEKQALSYIKKIYTKDTILIGMIDDPTILYIQLKAEKLSKEAKKHA
jgi:hypothetical protein